MRIADWMESREKPGTIAHLARRVLEKDAKFREVEQALQNLYILEAMLQNAWNRKRAAEAMGVSVMTVNRALRSMGIKSPQIREIAKRMGGQNGSESASCASR